MPKVNLGYQIDRDKSIGLGALVGKVIDSVGWGTNDAPDGTIADQPFVRLGDGNGAANIGGTPNNLSYWKTGANVTKLTGGDGTANPWWQQEATWGELEISELPTDTIVLAEVGTSANTLNGTNPAGNDGTALYTRKRVGGTAGLGKTQDFSIVARVRLDF